SSRQLHLSYSLLCSLPPPPGRRPTLFPYTTLFRSLACRPARPWERPEPPAAAAIPGKHALQRSRQTPPVTLGWPPLCYPHFPWTSLWITSPEPHPIRPART